MTIIITINLEQLNDTEQLNEDELTEKDENNNCKEEEREQNEIC